MGQVGHKAALAVVQLLQGSGVVDHQQCRQRQYGLQQEPLAQCGGADRVGRAGIQRCDHPDPDALTAGPGDLIAEQQCLPAKAHRGCVGVFQCGQFTFGDGVGQLGVDDLAGLVQQGKGAGDRPHDQPLAVKIQLPGKGFITSVDIAAAAVVRQDHVGRVVGLDFLQGIGIAEQIALVLQYSLIRQGIQRGGELAVRQPPAHQCQHQRKAADSKGEGAFHGGLLSKVAEGFDGPLWEGPFRGYGNNLYPTLGTVTIL